MTIRRRNETRYVIKLISENTCVEMVRLAAHVLYKMNSAIVGISGLGTLNEV